MKAYIILTIFSIIINIITFFMYKSIYNWECGYYKRNSVTLFTIILISISCFIPYLNICIAHVLLLDTIIKISDCSKSKIKDFFSKRF